MDNKVLDIIGTASVYGFASQEHGQPPPQSPPASTSQPEQQVPPVYEYPLRLQSDLKY